MAEKPNVRTNIMEYRTNGAAAYVARPLERELPVQKPRKKARPKAKLEIAPAGVLMLLVGIGALLVVLFSYMQLFTAKSEVAALETELARAQQENGQLVQEYNASVHMDEVRQKAKEFGMTTPNKAQLVYLHLSSREDWAELAPEPERRLLERVSTDLRRSIGAVLAFFS